ncbi:MAG: hypothetical protein H6807_01385 [Planctomycetes bacterium]|nr:hypothetical protein [Planctomycetota bacterium]
MSFEEENEAKASFDDVYVAPTPHGYIAAMAESGYQIGEQARRYCAAAARLLKERNGAALPLQMLDVGCSYGIGSAFVKYNCSFDEMVAFFATRAPADYRAACAATRMWLNITPPACRIRTVGLDSSEPAIRFAVDAGLLDGGIARDFELAGARPTESERAWFRGCNLLMSTGAIGYVTERTLDVVLRDLGKEAPGEFGPVAVVTILRMFDVGPIRKAFEDWGYAFTAVPGVRLPQRRFTDAKERREVLAILHQRGVETGAWEDDGRHYADLYVASAPEHLDVLLSRMTSVHGTDDDGGKSPFIHR